MAKNPKSDRFSLTREDWNKWTRDTILFTGPAVLLFLTALSAGKSLEEAVLILYGAMLNALTNLLKKYLSENT